mmetsp:Transcript_3421/g.11467  ORF Transcript_3421/g.11467 Transcript_3421/m.11467 type:complete len:192 (-) Transcript_3421:388-963(-)
MASSRQLERNQNKCSWRLLSVLLLLGLLAVAAWLAHLTVTRSPEVQDVAETLAPTTTALVELYQYLGRGECASANKDLFDQWSADRISYKQCEVMCSGLPLCLGFEFTGEEIAAGGCVLRFSDGTAPQQSPYPDALTGSWFGHNGVGPIAIAWDGTMPDVRAAVFTDRKCYRKALLLPTPAVTNAATAPVS